ncbi:MAG: thioredoxin [bacterium]|nr:thioredoxin [bacterium]
MSVLYWNDENFKDELQKSEVPVIVDFFADWCRPCKVLAPVFEELAAEYEGKCNFVKINVDESPNTTSSYSVMSIPTLIAFVKGEKKTVLTGAMGKEELVSFIEKHL